MTDINRLIAKAICQAQIASDAGKHRYEISPMKNRTDASATRYKYRVKEDFILSALRMIRSSHKSMFNYYCVEEADQNGYPSVVVYFDCKMPDGRCQVSFHTPLNKASDELVKMCGSGRKTRWDKEIGGSRNACQAMINYFNL